MKRCLWCCRPTHVHSDPDLRKQCRQAHFLFLHLSLKKWFACHGQTVRCRHVSWRCISPRAQWSLSKIQMYKKEVTKTGNWPEYICYHLAKGQNVSSALSWIVVLTPEMCPCSHTHTNTMCTICAPPRLNCTDTSAEGTVYLQSERQDTLQRVLRHSCIH